MSSGSSEWRENDPKTQKAISQLSGGVGKSSAALDLSEILFLIVWRRFQSDSNIFEAARLIFWSIFKSARHCPANRSRRCGVTLPVFITKTKKSVNWSRRWEIQSTSSLFCVKGMCLKFVRKFYLGHKTFCKHFLETILFFLNRFCMEPLYHLPGERDCAQCVFLNLHNVDF